MLFQDFIFVLYKLQAMAIWPISFQSCSVLARDIKLTGSERKQELSQQNKVANIPSVSGLQSCRWPGVTVERRMHEQVSWAAGWIITIILKKEILRAHWIAKDSLASSSSFALQKGAIKNSCCPKYSCIFLNPGNTLRPSFYFTSSVKIFLSTPTHSNCISSKLLWL